PGSTRRPARAPRPPALPCHIPPCPTVRVVCAWVTRTTRVRSAVHRADRVSAMSHSRTRLANVVRGGLIGIAEAIPGVSGGTVALVTGVYETIITSAGHLVSAIRAVVTDRARAREQFRQVRWDVLIPPALGMGPALIVALLIIGPAVEEHPVPMRALFLGMVAAALVVPVSMLGTRWRLREVVAAALGAVAVFLLIGTPVVELEPALPVVFAAAAF